MTGRRWIAALAAAALPMTIPVAASAAIYMNIPEIKGDVSAATGHGEWIELISYNVRLSPQLLPRGSGKFAVSKRTDRATPKLLEAATKGTHFPSVLLEVSTGTASRPAYLRYEMRNVFITGYSGGGSSSSAPTESFALNYEQIRYVPK
jgi:type VI protein secretion system component Hcp